jgi:hypothetical protein
MSVRAHRPTVRLRLTHKGGHMPRYLIERTFPDGLSIPMNGDGARACMGVVANNADKGVTWVHSYVTPAHLLHLRRPVARGDPQRRAAQRAAGRSHLRSVGARSVFLSAVN